MAECLTIDALNARSNLPEQFIYQRTKRDENVEDEEIVRIRFAKLMMTTIIVHSFYNKYIFLIFALAENFHTFTNFKTSRNFYNNIYPFCQSPKC